MDRSNRDYWASVMMKKKQEEYRTSAELQTDIDNKIREMDEQEKNLTEEKRHEKRRTRALIRSRLEPAGTTLHVRNWDQPNVDGSRIKTRETTKDQILNLGDSFKVHNIETAPCRLLEEALKDLREVGNVAEFHSDGRNDKMQLLIDKMRRPIQNWFEGTDMIGLLPKKHRDEAWERVARLLKDAVLNLQGELLEFQIQGADNIERKWAQRSILKSGASREWSRKRPKTLRDPDLRYTEDSD